VTKPTKIGTGIAGSAVVCAALAAGTHGVARAAWAWTTVACVIAAAAYLTNRPAWLGKCHGRWSARSILMLPYLAAFRVACGLMRWWRGGDAPTLIAPGLWVGGRITAPLPPDVTHVVDLVAEYLEPRHGRALSGYRSLPTLDGGVPSDIEQFTNLVRELAGVDGAVLVHCDSGRGRAPTFAAALLVARGLADDVDAAIALVQCARPVARPTRSDRAFLADTQPALRAISRTTHRADARRPAVAQIDH
jgi:protein-tyrosine phosphatase